MVEHPLTDGAPTPNGAPSLFPEPDPQTPQHPSPATTPQSGAALTTTQAPNAQRGPRRSFQDRRGNPRNHFGRGRAEGEAGVVFRPGRVGRVVQVWSGRVRGFVATDVNDTDATAGTVSDGAWDGSGRSTGRSNSGRIRVMRRTTTRFMVTARTTSASHAEPNRAPTMITKTRRSRPTRNRSSRTRSALWAP